MKKLLLAVCALLVPFGLVAQTVQQVSSDPPAASNVNCTGAPTLQQNTTNGHLSVCVNGTGWVTLTIPLTNATLARTDAANTFTGVQTFTAPISTNGTFTTPALVNPVVTGPAPVACGATCSPTAGQMILLNQAGGSTVTIPGATGTGNVIRMRISVITTSAAEKVLLTTVTDTIIGTGVGENSGTAKVFVGNAGTYHSLQMPFAGSQPSGGFVGDTITCTDVASTIWACDVQYKAGTTPTTPYSTSTS